MNWLMGEMIVLLLLAVAFGVLLGWLLWGWWRGQKASTTSGHKAASGAKVAAGASSAANVTALKAERSRAAALQQRCDEKDREIQKLKTALANGGQGTPVQAAFAAPAGANAQQLEAMEAEILSLRADADRAKADSVAAQSQRGEFEAEVVRLKTELDLARQEAGAQAGAADEAEGLRRQLSDAEAELAALRERADSQAGAADEAEGLRRQLSDAEAELADLRERAQAQAGAADEAEGLRRQLSDRDAELADLRERAQAQAGAADEAEGLRRQLSDAEAELADLRERAQAQAGAADEAEGLRRQLSDKEAELAALRERADSQAGAADEAEALRAQLSQAQAERDRNEAELARLEDDLGGVRAALDDCRRSGADKDRALAALQATASQGASEPDLPPAAKPKVLERQGPYGEPDDLKEIKGVATVLEAMLHDLNIYHFWQVASFTDEDVRWVNENLTAFKGRIQRDNWVQQAGELHTAKYAEPYHEAVKRNLGDE